MDNSSLCGTSVSEPKKSEAVHDSDSVSSLGNYNSVDKLRTCFSGKVKINDGYRTNNSNDVHVERYYTEEEEEEVEEEEEEEDDFSEEDLLAQMGYAKSETGRDILKDPQRQYCDENEEEKEEDDLSEESFLAQMGYLKNEPPKHEPITTPTANLNLVSAFKGSREKQGKPDRKFRVSWAPDVYDPPPTSDDHFAQSKTERHKSEQRVKGAAGKNRQKCGGKSVIAIEDGGGGGKGSKGGGSKGSAGGGKAAGKHKDKKVVDKKQAKKHGGGASKYSNFGDY